MSPKGRREQHQQRKYFQAAHQHCEAEDGLAGFADRRIVICHLAQPWAEVVHGGNNGREGRNKIEFSCQQCQPNEHEAEHVDSEKAPNGTDDLGLNTAGIQFERNDGVGVQQLPQFPHSLSENQQDAHGLHTAAS